MRCSMPLDSRGRFGATYQRAGMRGNRLNRTHPPGGFRGMPEMREQLVSPFYEMRWCQLRMSLSALILLLTACGGRTESDLPDGSSTGVATAACPVCSNHWLACSAPNVEAVDFKVESQNDMGCAGYVYASQMATTPFSVLYTIICDPPQVCDDLQCYPASLTTNSFFWATATCRAEPG